MKKFTENEINKHFDDTFDDKIKDINEQLEQKVTIAMIGDINTGKSSTINQIIGDEVATVGSQPGETEQIDLYQYKDNIVFADTPGLDDMKEDHSNLTLDYYKNADVILFFLNAAGTVLSESERKTFVNVSKMNPYIIIVLNKIDAAENIPSILNYIREHLGQKYNIIPISSKSGEGIERLRLEILKNLEKVHKDTQFARHIQGEKNKSAIANRWITAAASSASLVGVAPIPGSDIVPITGIQVGLMMRLAILYDKPISKKRAKELTIAALTGSVGKNIFRQIVKLIPGAGSIAGAGVAGSMTLALGYTVKYIYENDLELNHKTLLSLYSTFKKGNQLDE